MREVSLVKHTSNCNPYIISSNTEYLMAEDYYHGTFKNHASSSGFWGTEKFVVMESRRMMVEGEERCLRTITHSNNDSEQ